MDVPIDLSDSIQETDITVEVPTHLSASIQDTDITVDVSTIRVGAVNVHSWLRL